MYIKEWCNQVEVESNEVGNQVEEKSNQVEHHNTELRHSDTRLRLSGTNLDTQLKELKNDFSIDDFVTNNFWATEACRNFIVMAYR